MRWRARMTTRSSRYTDSIRRGRTMRAESGKWKRFTRSKRSASLKRNRMSIEIEVGLENATRVKPRTEELRLDEAPVEPQTNAKLRNRLIFGGAAGLGPVEGLFLYSFNSESPHHAQGHGHLT